MTSLFNHHDTHNMFTVDATRYEESILFKIFGVRAPFSWDLALLVKVRIGIESLCMKNTLAYSFKLQIQL